MTEEQFAVWYRSNGRISGLAKLYRSGQPSTTSESADDTSANFADQLTAIFSNPAAQTVEGLEGLMTGPLGLVAMQWDGEKVVAVPLQASAATLADLAGLAPNPLINAPADLLFHRELVLIGQHFAPDEMSNIPREEVPLGDDALYATPIDFGPGTIIGFSGTFVAPAGPHSPTDVWAVAILARTGGVADLPSEIRTVVSFQIRGRAARINMLGGTAPVNSDFLPQAAYDEIFDPVTPQPFTLEFLIDRTTGMAHGKLKLRHTTVSKDILLQDFRADSGPTISAVGAGIAIANAPGQTASVRVLDFKIFGDRSSLARSTIDPCPASFGCRMVPSSQTP
ncbi:MAG TPA: hypothetical protein VJ692_04765 [Nitrospiraceae bacterium]|nr:hypothetical protein [Nitrospiraceae bacterium]